MTKAEQAQTIFTEVNGVRGDFIQRAMDELGMSKAGASTYFQNAKVKAAGGKIKHYSKSSSKSTDKATNETVDDSMEDAPLFSVTLKDGTEQCFMSQQALTDFQAANQALLAA